MPDREKVIKGLECHKRAMYGEVDEHGMACNTCPYKDMETTCCSTTEGRLIEDALALLKAQQPRVLSREEMKALNRYAIVWYENINTEDALPRIANYVSDYGVHFTDGAIWRFDADRYGSVWRCWTARPTDEQRKAVRWDES